MNQKPLWLLYKTDQGIPQLLSKAFHQGQFKEATGKHDQNNWNLYWKACGFTNSDYKNVKRWQILNHFPKGNTITRKDSLARCLKRMRMVYGSVYNFFPASYNLPNDYKKFLSYFTKVQNKKGKQTWICKPSDLSRGRGIFLFDCLSDLLYEGSTVVQRYIDNPYLIGGYKFDLRIYAVATSYHPLRIYIHQDGLVRFSTEKYAGSVLHNKYAHLTNTSINRNGPCYNTEKERIGAGCKWTISQLRAYFQQCSIDDRLIWERIKHVISLTILMQANAIPEYAKQSIELYGFDIILDQKLKPWLLEVNFTPALGNDCAADVSVKLPMLVDFLELARQKMIHRPTTDHRLHRNIALSKDHARKKEERQILEMLLRQTRELAVLRRDKADQSKLMKSIVRHEKLRRKCRMLVKNGSQEQESKDEEGNDFDDVFKSRFIMDPYESENLSNIPKMDKKFKIPDIPSSTTPLIKSSLSIDTESVKSKKTIKTPVPLCEHSTRSHSSNSFKSSMNSSNSVTCKDYKNTANSLNSVTCKGSKNSANSLNSVTCKGSKNTANSLNSVTCKDYKTTANSLNSVTCKDYKSSINSANSVTFKDYKVGGFFLTYPISNDSQTYSKGVTDISKAVSEIRNILRVSECTFKISSPQRRELHERTTVNWNALSGLRQAN